MPVSIRFKGVVGTTAQLESDKYAGRIGFNTTLARYVVYFDATNYATMARRDVLETFAAGIQDSTLTSTRVMVAGTSGRHQGFAGLTFASNALGVGDGTGDANVILNKADANTAALRFRVAGVERGAIFLSNSEVFGWESKDAAGAAIDIPITFPNTSAGLITIGGSTNRPLRSNGAFAVNTAPRPTQEYIYTTYSETTMQGVNVEYLAAAVGQPLVTANATGTADATQILFRGRSLATNRFLVYANGDVDIAAAYKTGGVTRISSGGAGTLTTLSTTGLATLAQATVSDLTTGRMVSTTTGGRLQALNYVPLGNTTGGAGEPRIASGVVGGQVIIVSGLDVTDAGAFSYLQMNNATWQAGGDAVSTQITGTSFTALAPDVTLGNGGGSSTVQFSAPTVRKVISGTTETIGGNIFNQYTAVTQTGIVTNQSLASTGAGSRTIGAGRLNSLGAGMELYLCGTYTTDAAPGDATIRVRIGSTTFRTIGSFALDSSITGGIWWIRGRITTRTTGATGTVGGQLMWEHQGSTVVGSEVLHVQPSTSTADVTIDLTASQTIDVDWTATDAGTSITCTCFSIDLIR